MEYNACEIWDAQGVLEKVGGHSVKYVIPKQEVIPVHPEGYVLWRGFMSEKARLNSNIVEPVKEKKKENSILKKMSGNTIKNADTHVLVK